MAVSGAKAGAGATAGMDLADLKRHLRFALEEPIQVALALGADGKAVLQMHRRKPGRALEKQLKESAPDSKNHRWGTAVVDQENPKLVRFIVNKAGGGLARKLVVALKGTGFNKVELVLEDGSAVDGAQDDETPEEDTSEEGGTSADPAEASPDADPAADAQPGDRSDPPLAADAGDAAGDQPADPAADDSPQPDAKALAARLSGLVKQMMAAIASDPSRKAALVELATDAQASLKRGDLTQASAGMDVLEQAFATSGGAEAGPDTGQEPQADAETTGLSPAAKQAVPVIAKARGAWMATRKRVEADVGNLHETFASALKGHEMEGDLVKAFRDRVDTVLDTLDEALAHTLDAVNQAQNDAERAKLVDEAHATVRCYNDHIARDPTIALLDSNPFVQMSVQKTMSATLAALSKAIR